MLSTNQNVLLFAALEPIPPTVRIEQTPSFPALPGQEVLVSVQAESAIGGNFDITSMTLSLNGEIVQLETVRAGLARGIVVAPGPGKYQLVAEATDTDGWNRGVAVLPESTRCQ